MLVAHFSDPHLLSLRGVRPWHFLGKRLTGGANLLFNRGGEFPESVARLLVDDLRRQRVDHVVVSGDLTNLAFPAEFELVRDLLQQLGAPDDVTVVPGNHDYYTLGSRRRDHFRRIMAHHLVGEVQPCPGAFPVLRLREDLAVVALGSAHPTPPFIAWGTLGRRQIEQAGDLLSSAACRGRFRLVVLHHPPHMEHVGWDNRLRDLPAFAAMIRAAGAELVVHGHLHRSIRQQLEGPAGPVPVIGVASGTWLSPKDPARRARYNIYRIEGTELQEVRTRRLAREGGCFKPVV